MFNHPLFRNKRTEKGPGLQFEIRKLTAEELQKENEELNELIESDSAAESTTETVSPAKSSKIDLAAAEAFLQTYNRNERKEAVDGLVEALKKARGLE